VNKSKIRKKLLTIRKKKNSNNLEINDDYLFKVLKKIKIPNKMVGGYYPYNFEVDVIKILEKLEKKNYKIYLPRIKKNFQMDFFRWSLKEPLLINKFGIPEPMTNKIEYPDILLVPIVAFDKKLNRLGYGGGFYDRYISRLKIKKKIILIGLAFSFQKVEKIFINKYDMKLDYIITEKNLLK